MLSLHQLTAAFMSALALAACGQSGQTTSSFDPQWQQPGWHYRFEGNRGAAIYRLGKPDQTHFMAMCDGIPTFHLNQALSGNATAFTITIDGKSWRKPIAFEAGFTIADPQITEAFSQARRSISYRVGNRVLVEFAPSRLVARLINDCRRTNRRSGK